MLNITSGIYRSRKLKFDEKNVNLRPTKNNVRNALFSIIKNEVGNSTFLDMFGGTGAIGIEAISNNAKHVVFYENNKENISFLKTNIKELKIDSNHYQIEEKDVMKELKNINKTFDIIFVDPPYKKYDYQSLLDLIFESKVLNKNCLIIFESEKELIFSNFEFQYKIYKYGRVYLTKLWNVKRK